MLPWLQLCATVQGPCRRTEERHGGGGGGVRDELRATAPENSTSGCVAKYPCGTWAAEE